MKSPALHRFVVFFAGVAMTAIGVAAAPPANDTAGETASEAPPEHPAVTAWKTAHGADGYRFERDAARHLVYATALDEDSHTAMRAMLEAEADHLIAVFFDAPPAYDVLVAVPTAADARSIFKDREQVGGIYEHHHRRLVARDIGGTLRHEFFHLMHHGDMERRGQRHAMWLIEGMASLYETYELDPDGSIRFLPNHRHNNVVRFARRNALIPWETLFRFSPQQFMTNPAVTYPQSRSIFEFIAERGLLEDFYEAYVEHHREERTGSLAVEMVFQRQLDLVEKQWRQWLEQKGEVAVNVDFGEAGLGIHSDVRGNNDGVKVTGVVPDSAADRARIRAGDVIVAVNDDPTRSFFELRRIIGQMKPGLWVELRVRRGKEYVAVPLKLKPMDTNRQE